MTGNSAKLIDYWFPMETLPLPRLVAWKLELLFSSHVFTTGYVVVIMFNFQQLAIPFLASHWRLNCCIAGVRAGQKG